MLNSFRNFSGSIATKLMLVLLIASFALWGIGDMLGTSARNHALAVVGDKTIAAGDYQRELAIETDNVRRSLGATYSPELIKRLNVPQFVLQRMVQQSLLQQEAERIGFIPDDTTIALEIRKNPSFLNNSGVFDKARFENALRSQAVSEKNYIEKLRMDMATTRLLDALAIDLPLTPPMVSMLQSAYNQGLDVTIYRLSSAPAPARAAPTDDELASFHKEHAELFTTPEMRAVSFVRFSEKDLGNAPVSITAEAIEQYYQAHPDQFETPEKREVEQLLYGSEDKAREAYGQVRLGKSFADVADALPPSNRGNLSLGLIERKGMMESAADTVFRLKEGEASEPVQSPFGWHIFRVARIAQSGPQPLEKVRPQIEAQLKNEARENMLGNKINELEDALAGGATLTEVARQMDFTLEQAGTFDKYGNNAQGKPATTIPPLEKFVDSAYRTEEKTESSVISAQGGVYYVLRVDDIAPEKLKPLESVRSEVARALAEYEAERRAANMASLIEKELGDKKPAKDIIAGQKLAPTASGTITRSSNTLGGIMLPPLMVNQLFSTPVGGLTRPVRERSGDYLVAVIDGVSPGYAASSEKADARRKETLQSMQEEMMMQYMKHLEARYPVEVHQAVLDQLLKDTSDAAR